MYKRQQFGEVFTYDVSISLKSETALNEDEMQEILNDPEPVSYTHLDVYKRQGIYSTVIAAASANFLVIDNVGDKGPDNHVEETHADRGNQHQNNVDNGVSGVHNEQLSLIHI